MILYIILWIIFVILIITIWDYYEIDNYSNIKYIKLDDKSY